jgi:hypothetical protein
VASHTARSLSLEQMGEELDRVSRPAAEDSVRLKHRPDPGQTF